MTSVIWLDLSRQLEQLRYWEKRRKQEEEDKRLALLLLNEQNAQKPETRPGITNSKALFLFSSSSSSSFELFSNLKLLSFSLPAPPVNTEADALIARQISETVMIFTLFFLLANLSNLLQTIELSYSCVSSHRWKRRKKLEKK